MEEYLKPLPSPTRDTQAYWDGLAQGRLLLQKCGSCGKIRHYPRPLCDHCHSFAVEWVEACGRGRVHSWTVTHHAFNIGFKRELPFTLVTVDLAEGVRMQAQLKGDGRDRVALDLPVELRFERPKADLTLPYFVVAS